MVNAILAFLKAKNKKEARVLFPGYFCAEPLQILKYLPISIRYYPVTRELYPDWESVRKILEQEKIDIFVIVHYFGFPNQAKIARMICDEFEMFLIEDAAHVFPFVPYVGTYGDAIIFSPRKFLSIPEGGLLQIKASLREYIDIPEFKLIHKTSFRWLLKKLLQYIFIKLNINWYRFHGRSQQMLLNADIKKSTYIKKEYKSFLNSDTNIDRNFPPDLFSYKMFLALIQEFENVKKQRRLIYFKLCDIVQSHFGCKPLKSEIGDVIPYALPVVVDDQNYIIRILKKNGIPADIWPDLPPEILANNTIYKDAIWLHDNIVLIHLHHGIKKISIRS
jgi:hypothetical protein